MGNDGEIVDFPCSKDEISDWLDTVTDKGKRLFSSFTGSGNMPKFSVPWPSSEFDNIVPCIGSPWNGTNSDSGSVAATYSGPFSHFANERTITLTERVVSRNDCFGGYRVIQCTEKISCEIWQNSTKLEYNYPVEFFMVNRPSAFDYPVMGARVARRGISEHKSNDLHEFMDCSGEDAYYGETGDNQYTRSWFTPFGKLAEYMGETTTFSRQDFDTCTNNVGLECSVKKDTTIDHLVFQSIGTQRTKALVWVLALRPSYKEIHLTYPEAIFDNDYDSCVIFNDNESWEETREDRKLFIHASSLFAGKTEVQANDPVSWGRNNALEDAIHSAYENAYLNLGIEEKENPYLSIAFQVVL